MPNESSFRIGVAVSQKAGRRRRWTGVGWAKGCESGEQQEREFLPLTLQTSSSSACFSFLLNSAILAATQSFIYAANLIIYSGFST